MTANYRLGATPQKRREFGWPLFAWVRRFCGRLSRAVLGVESQMSPANSLVRTVGESVVPGTYLQAFIQNGDHFFVTEIKIYKDGKIDCWGVVSFDEFKQKIREGWVRTNVPNGARISTMLSTLSFTASEVRGGIEEAEFVKQVADEIEKLNGRPASAEICRARMRDYKAAPSEERKRALRTAYENVPAHMRRFLGDMDSKDWEYRNILGIA